MSKTIKLEDVVYEKLEANRLKRETFSQGVARLLRLRDAVKVLRQILDEGSSEKEVPHD